MLQIPISWKQYDPYSRPPRPLGLGPRLVRDSDLELKKAERRGGSSWVTAGIPRSLPLVGEGGKERAEVGGWGWQSSEGGRVGGVGGSQVCGRLPVILADPHSFRGFWRTTKTMGRPPRIRLFLDLNSPASSLNAWTDGDWWRSKIQVAKYNSCRSYAGGCTL